MTKNRYNVTLAGAALLAIGGIGTAHAQATFGTGFNLTFTETTPNNAFFIVANTPNALGDCMVVNATDTCTEMVAFSVPVTVSLSYPGSLFPPSFPATFNLSATSTDAASITNSGTVLTQNFLGAYSITSNVYNYLSGTFSGGYTDDVSGVLGSSDLTLSAPDPFFTLTMTSNIIPPADLAVPLDMLISLTNVTPSVGYVGVSPLFTLASATAIDPGYFSANLVQAPEPASLAVLGVAFSGLAIARRGRRTKPSYTL